MVKLNDLTADYLKSLGFKTKVQGIQFIKDKVPEYKRLTRAELDIQLRAAKAAADREIARRLEVQGAKPLTPTLLNQLHANAPKAISYSKRSTREPGRFRPKYIQIHVNRVWKNDRVPNLTSDQLHQLIQALQAINACGRVVYTKAEQRNYYNSVRQAIQPFDADFDSIDFHEQNIFTDDELGLYYIVNGYYYDFGAFLMGRYAEEPPDIRTADGTPLKCILACIVSQTKQFLGVRKTAKLYQYNTQEISLQMLDNIAKEFELHIKIYDMECNKWREYDYSPEKRRNHSNLVSIIVKNEHSYNIKKEFKQYDVLHVDDSLTHITLNPITHDVPDVHYGTFTLNDQLVFDNNNSLDIITTGVYFNSDSTDFNKVVEYLITRGIYPNVIPTRSAMLSVNFALENPKREIQLRNSAYKHEYLDFIPHSYNFTINSCAMYLFRTFIQQSLLKMTDPVISRIFKLMCSPLIHITPTQETNTHVYAVDINRAYRSLCANIGVFSKQPNIAHVNQVYTKSNIPLTPGVYQIGNDWVIHEDLEYELTRGREHLVNYAIYYDQTTNVLDEFADALYNDQLVVPGITHKKEMFNSLIGKFNPHPDEQSTVIILKSELDLSRFLTVNNKTIHWVYKMGDHYMASFSYSDVYYRGTNLEHISAQIIQRCRLAIKKLRDTIADNYDVNIVGTMTDSLIFTSKLPVDFEKLGIPISDKIGEFKLTQSDSIVAVGPGQYCLYNAGGENVVLRLQGITENRSLMTLEQLMGALRKRRKTKTIHEINPDNTQLHTVFIGEAGVGKSRYILTNYLNKRDYIRLSPSGVSAYSIRTTTISSFFCLGERNERSVLEAFEKMSVRKKIRLQNVSTIILDECYTIPTSVAEKMSDILKLICRSHKPFANKQLLLFGDDRQLSSVGESFMESALFKSLKSDMKPIEYNPEKGPRLTPEYRELVNYLRVNRTAAELGKFIGELSKKCAPEPIGDYTVYYENKDVDHHNAEKLNTLPGDLQTVNGKSFKEGSRIMLKQNESIKNGIYNGRICKLIGYETNKLTIELDERRQDGTSTVRTLTLAKYNNFVPAYAMTIHKVQGLTLDSINVYMRKSQLSNRDATRLLYVALTRVRSLDKVHIKLID